MYAVPQFVIEKDYVYVHVNKTTSGEYIVHSGYGRLRTADSVELDPVYDKMGFDTTLIDFTVAPKRRDIWIVTDISKIKNDFNRTTELVNFFKKQYPYPVSPNYFSLDSNYAVCSLYFKEWGFLADHPESKTDIFLKGELVLDDSIWKTLKHIKYHKLKI
jgi:hypothetical protein